MKKTIILFLAVFFWVSLASAFAADKTYTVQGGDTVYRIATEVFNLGWSEVTPEWREKDLIYPGDIISLDEIKKTRKTDLELEQVNQKTKLKKQIQQEKINLWQVVGGNPYRGTAEKAINGFKLPEKVKSKFQKQIRRGGKSGFSRTEIQTGDRFEQLNFGRGEVWNNVICAWPNTEISYSAKEYISGSYHLVEILKCGNWGWWKKKKAPPPPKPPPPPPFLSEELQTMLLGDYQSIYLKNRLDWDSTWGAFREHYHDGNDVAGWWQTSVVYPLIFDDAEGNEWSFGVAFGSRDWEGETGEVDPYNYKGDVRFWNFAARFRDSNRGWELIGRAGYGKREDTGYLTNEWGKYSAKQETDLFNLYFSAEYNAHSNKAWFSKLRGSLDLEFDQGSEKEDYWYDNWSGTKTPLYGDPDPKDAYSASLYANLFSFDAPKDTIGLWADLRGTYYEEGAKFGFGPKGGLWFFNEAIKIGPGYTWWYSQDEDWDAPDAEGLYAEVNLYNLWRWFKKDSGLAQKGKTQKELKKNLLNVWGLKDKPKSDDVENLRNKSDSDGRVLEIWGLEKNNPQPEKTKKESDENHREIIQVWGADKNQQGDSRAEGGSQKLLNAWGIS